MAEAALDADFGFGAANVAIRNTIEDDVIRQTETSLAWEIQDVEIERRLMSVAFNATSAVEVQTEAIGGLVSVPPLVGTISVARDYSLTFADEITPEPVKGTVVVSVDIEAQ